MPQIWVNPPQLEFSFKSLRVFLLEFVPQIWVKPSSVGGGSLQAGAQGWREDNADDPRGEYTISPIFCPRGEYSSHICCLIFLTPEVNISEIFITFLPYFFLLPQRWILSYYHTFLPFFYHTSFFTPVLFLATYFSHFLPHISFFLHISPFPYFPLDNVDEVRFWLLTLIIYSLSFPFMSFPSLWKFIIFSLIVHYLYPYLLFITFL